MNMWRAGCGGSRTSGSEGGQEKPTSRKADRALLSDPYTYVWTPAGFCYVSFITDVFSRRTVGWRAATRMTTPFVLSALEQALFTRRRTSFEFTTAGLLHHSDAGG